MTDNEAIKELKEAIDCCTSGEEEYFKESLGMGILAIEEIQQYRAIGTVEDLKTMKENGAFSGVELAQILAMQMELKKYQSIGTVEEFKALKEKNEPYKPIVYEDKYYGCKCGEVLLEKWEEYPKKLMPKSWGLPYCLGCGQKLDWQ